MQDKVGSVENDISIKKVEIIGCKIYDADTVFEVNLKRKKKTKKQHEIVQDFGDTKGMKK